MRFYTFLLAFVLVLSSAHAFMSSIPTSDSIGFDYFLMDKLYEVHVTAYYNDTDIYLDTSLSGILTYETSLDKGDSTTLSTSLPTSTLVHSTKPITIVVYSDDYSGSRQYARGGVLLPAAQNLDKEYYVANPLVYTDSTAYVYITATQSGTNLKIDNSNDGTWDTDTTITPGIGYSYTHAQLSPGDRILASKPILVYQRPEKVGNDYAAKIYNYDLRNATGTQFYAPTPLTKLYVVAVYDNTNFSIDNNNDGTFDYSTILDNTDTYSSTSWAESAFISSDKPVVVSAIMYTYDDGLWTGILVPPAKELGREYFNVAPFSSSPLLYVGAVVSNTNLLIDKEDDGTWDTNTTINPGDITSYSTGTVQVGSRIYADKPINVHIVERDNTGTTSEEGWGFEAPQTGISLTSEISPSPADFNTLANITSLIWNMAEIMYNFSVSGSILSDFTPYPDTATLNITVSKHWALNDTQIGATDHFSVTISGSGPYQYSFDQTDTTLLEEIDDEQYIKFVYKASTPSSTGTYIFDPFTVNVEKATVWRYTWE